MERHGTPASAGYPGTRITGDQYKRCIRCLGQTHGHRTAKCLTRCVLIGLRIPYEPRFIQKDRAKALTFAPNLKERLVFHFYFRVFT